MARISTKQRLGRRKARPLPSIWKKKSDKHDQASITYWDSSKKFELF